VSELLDSTLSKPLGAGDDDHHWSWELPLKYAAAAFCLATSDWERRIGALIPPTYIPSSVVRLDQQLNSRDQQAIVNKRDCRVRLHARPHPGISDGAE
jgi:hypothetical protein